MANPPKNSTFDWEMYRYVPSLPGATLGIVVFFVPTLVLSWQWFRARNSVLVFVIIGTLSEVGGYAARVGSHYDNQAWAPFIIQGTLLLIGPLFFAATIYMMLGQTILLAGGEQVSVIRPKWYTRIFVGADIFTLVLQGLGASIMGTMKLQLAIAGEKVVIAGLSMQVATFVFFLVAAIDFQIRMEGKLSVSTPVRSTGSSDWRKMLYILYNFVARPIVTGVIFVYVHKIHHATTYC
ncbi:hypothetical protein GRF29_69g24093 [Pseudopithomyces chartarum]|uniref:Uncharacterized protein n=1 Tax=Pseudopithomyces chartarum TaxID=1892770 RepID=A0AAN6RG45_9PLEO|nr:hypothetical protein GRF29_69g24093 [Pseudopithomyces chartarum]